MVYILCGEFAGFEQALLSDIRQNVFRERFILKLLFMHEARRREGKIASERERESAKQDGFSGKNKRSTMCSIAEYF